MARRLGFIVNKTRRAPSLANFGLYQLRDANNRVVAGTHFECNLNDIENALMRFGATAGNEKGKTS